MQKRSKAEKIESSLRDKIIGLGEKSIRKSYYPQLQKELKSMEKVRKELAESQANYQSLVENINDVIFSLNAEGTITYISPSIEVLAGYMPKEVIGKSFQEFILPIDMPIVEVMFKNALNWNVEPQEYRVTCKDGTLLYVRSSTRPVLLKGKIVGLTGVMSDITNRKKAEENLLKLANIYATLSHTNETIVHAKNRDDLFRGICIGAVEKGKFILACVSIVDEEAHTAEPVCFCGTEDGFLDSTLISENDLLLGSCLTETAICENKVLWIDDIATDERFLPWRDAALKKGYYGSAGLPLRFHGKVIGTLTLYAGEAGFFDTAQRVLLEEMSVAISYGLENLERERLRQQGEKDLETTLEKLRVSLDSSILMAASITEKRDPYTAGHQKRVSQLAVAIAREMNLPEETIKGIKFSAMIHDIGKISIPAEILSKPSALNEIEYLLIKIHPQSGYDILKDIDFTWPIAKIVLQHHERLDGSGYPMGLKGEEILLEARIIAVADVVEAISTHRPYRPGLGVNVALDEIQNFRGTYYDAKVVDACVMLFKEKGYAFS